MTKNNGFKVAALAASIALAMGATSAMAATPAAGQLPGQGKVVLGTVTPATPDTKTLNLTVGGAPAVINWGAGTTITDINPSGVAGFNIGTGATVNVDVSAVGAALLNIDSTANPSQIFGTLAVTGNGNVYVANTNGVVVGASGVITNAGTGTIGLVANTLKGSGADFAGTLDGTSTQYNGTGGDVTVQAGATSGAKLFISGGSAVNVNLAGLTGATTISAGRKAGASTTLADNKSASATVTGGTAAPLTLASLDSAGTATTNGMLTLTADTVDGVLTNNGSLTFTGAAHGAVVNMGQLNTAATSTFDSLTNNGSITAGGGIEVNADGDLVNNGSITGAGAIAVDGGNFTNGTGAAIAGATTVNVTGGNLTNAGSIAVSGAVSVLNGAINNSGKVTGASAIATTSDSTDSTFASAGQYYINNTGTITSAGALTVDANATAHNGGSANNSTGSFTNSGALNLGNVGALTIKANNNVNLGGTLKAINTAVPPALAALSATNPLGAITLAADANDNGTGVLTVGAPLFFGATTTALSGAQVKVMANVTGSAAGAPAGTLTITGGDAPAGGDYAVRIANGTTSSAATVNVLGTAKTNTILQGTIAGGTLNFGGTTTPISDIISGPNGGLSASTAVNINFNGRLKTAPYLNDPNNFRYNYLPITNTGTGSLALNLNPVAYTTNGTSNGLSGVNLLVNGDVTLANTSAGVGQNGTGSAVTGVTNLPNTHLVLQSTGDISTTGYWPGYVYLGTIDSDSNGNALPGTLGGGSIALTGAFNNVLPGDVAGASGIHFMTGNALVGTSTVTTNANALINFPTDLLTQGYAQGVITGGPAFYAGTATGLIVNYAAFKVGQTQQLFNTHPVDATK